MGEPVQIFEALIWQKLHVTARIEQKAKQACTSVHFLPAVYKYVYILEPVSIYKNQQSNYDQHTNNGLKHEATKALANISESILDEPIVVCEEGRKSLVHSCNHVLRAARSFARSFVQVTFLFASKM